MANWRVGFTKNAGLGERVFEAEDLVVKSDRFELRDGSDETVVVLPKDDVAFLQRED